MKHVALPIGVRQCSSRGHSRVEGKDANLRVRISRATAVMKGDEDHTPASSCRRGRPSGRSHDPS